MSNALNNAGKLAKVVHLIEPRFGYVEGTGVNNTAAVQACIDAAVAIEGTAVLPAHLIEHTGVTIGGAVTIMGAGKFRTTLRLLGSATGAHGITFAANVDEADVHIMDLGLDGRYGSMTSGHGIYLPDEATLSYGRGLKLTRVYITKFAGKGLYVGANRNNGKTYDLEISRCEDGIYIDDSSDWKNIHPEIGIVRQYCVNIPGAGADNKFTDGSMWEAAEAAVNLGTTGSSPNTFTGVTFDHHTKNAVRISGNAGSGQPHAFIGCWFRENSEAGDGLHAQILLTDTAGAVFIGNRFTDQEGNPRPSYVVEFSGTCGAVIWDDNYVETDAYATALTNDVSKLVSRCQSLTAVGTVNLGGESGAQGLVVNAGVAGGNYITITPRAAGTPADIAPTGVDSTINLRLYSKGTGSAVDLQPGTVRAMRAVHVASGVNWVDVYSGATGNPSRIVANGETDTSVSVEGLGTGGVLLKDGGAATKIALDTTGIGFYGASPVAKPTGVAVDAAGIHAALVTLGLIAA